MTIGAVLKRFSPTVEQASGIFNVITRQFCFSDHIFLAQLLSYPS